MGSDSRNRTWLDITSGQSEVRLAVLREDGEIDDRMKKRIRRLYFFRKMSMAVISYRLDVSLRNVFFAVHKKHKTEQIPVSKRIKKNDVVTIYFDRMYGDKFVGVWTLSGYTLLAEYYTLFDSIDELNKISAIVSDINKCTAKKFVLRSHENGFVDIEKVKRWLSLPNRLCDYASEYVGGKYSFIRYIYAEGGKKNRVDFCFSGKDIMHSFRSLAREKIGTIGIMKFIETVNGMRKKSGHFNYDAIWHWLGAEKPFSEDGRKKAKCKKKKVLA